MLKLNFEKTKAVMTYKRYRSEVIYERDNFIVSTFRDIKRTCRYKTMNSICKVIAVLPADRHYLSEEIAYIIWKNWRNNKIISWRNRMVPEEATFYKRKLYESFIAECEKLQKNGMRKNRDIIRAALNCPAKCIGISPHRIFLVLKSRGEK